MSDWQRLRGIVEEALGVSDAERAMWLERACDGDTDLHTRARRLLDASLTEDAFLRAPTAPQEGDGIGPYRLVRRVASGGMGTVFVAEREKPQRRVALKLMRTGLIGPEAVARFRYEVAVLASLQHPHIAAMYETGLHEELPWFAMEYVEDARTIVAYAEEEGLDAGARLALLETVCDAVHHGHAKGILHRDLKPDNLLVGRDGRCKVIDFGVARATDSDLDLTTLRTSTGEIVGTLAYMSPEQIVGDRGAIDTRSDVYALGVVLYELLTGVQPCPVKGKTFFEAVRAIRDDTPQRRAELKGDLETIVLKCLAKEPSQRYASAAALADDLRRFRAHEPIAARPPSVGYQLRTFARRHRVLVGAAALVLVVSVAAAVVSAVWAGEARDAREEMRAERDKARGLFATSLDRSHKATHKHARRVQDLAGGAEPAVAMVQDAIADLEALLALEPGNREVRLRLIKAYIRLGRLRGDPAVVTSEGRIERSRKAYGKALDLARALHGEHPDDADAMHVHGRALALVGLAGKDEGVVREGIALMEKVPTRSLEMTRHLAYAHQTLGVWCMDGEDFAGGRAHLSRQEELLEEYARRQPDRLDAHLDLAKCRSNLAGLAAARGDYKTAAPGFSEALEGLDRLREQFPESRIVLANAAWNALQLGRCRAVQQEFEAAEKLLRRAIDGFETMRDTPDRRMNLCTAYFMLGNVLTDLSKRSENRRALLALARDAYRQALLVGRKCEKPPVPLKAIESRYERLDRALSRG